MIAPASDARGLASSRSYFSLLRRLNLLRQVISFRADRNWDGSGSPLERTRQFFIARGTIPYHFQTPIDLSESPNNPFRGVSVFFGPPRSDQLLIFGRRQADSHHLLVHFHGTTPCEHHSFPLDKRFGVSRRARLTSLFGWRTRWGTVDQYINPVEFVTDAAGVVTGMRVRVNAVVEEGPSDEMPAQLVGKREGDTWEWTIDRLGQAHDWFPDANVKLFLPGYEPHEVVYGLSNEQFICKGPKKAGKGTERWAVWNDCWERAGHRPLVWDLDGKQIGRMAVNAIDKDRTVYSCVLGSLPPSHPLAGDCPGILITSGGGQLGMIPLDDLVDIRHVLAVHIAGSVSGLFHCVRRGPTAQLVIHQNGVPLGSSLDDLEFHGFSAEEERSPQPLIRVKLVASENNGQRLVLYTATTTAWTDTLAMMNRPISDLHTQHTEQARALKRFIEERQGSSVTALQPAEGKQRLDRSALVKWWRYLVSQIEQRLGEQPGPYVTRAQAIRLLNTYRLETGEYSLEPLLVPLAKLFGVDVRAVGNLESDPEFVRYSDELKAFLVENRLVIGSNDLAPSKARQAGPARNGGQVMLILHPSALQWASELDEEPAGASAGRSTRLFGR